MTSWPSVIAYCGLFIAFGGLALKNSQVSSDGAGEHSLQTWLEKLAAKGTPVINISPTRDDYLAFLNAEWIPIRSNTDKALMLSLAWEIQHHGAQDQTFLERYCVGWPQLVAYLLRGAGDGLAKTPQWASAITGIPAERIRRLAQQLMAAPFSMMICAYALQRAHRGEQPYWIVIALAVMLGQIGLPGSGFAFGHGSMNSVGNPRLDALAPSLPLGVNSAADLTIPVARIADMLPHPGGEYSFQGQQRRYLAIDMIY